MYFCILDRLDLFFYLPSYPIRLPSFFSARMVLVSLVCLLSDRCRVNVTQSVVHVYMFISCLLIGTNYTYMCVAKHIRRSVVHFQLCLLIFGSPNRFLHLQTFGL